jgi:hypothetical protein
MAKRKKTDRDCTQEFGTAISLRVQKPFMKDLDAYREPLRRW